MATDKPLYKIRNWAETFERAQTRKQPNEMSWVPMPTRMDGKRYRRIAEHANGAMVLGCWLVMVEIAARRPKDRRGYLEDSDGPMGPEDLSAASGLPPACFEVAIKVLAEKGIEWLVVENSGNALPEQPAAVVEQRVEVAYRTEQDRTEQDTKRGAFRVDHERFIREYPREVTEYAMRQFLSEVRAQGDNDLFFANLALYRETDQWRRNVIPSAENFIRKGMWKVPPKREGDVRAEPKMREYNVEDHL